MQHSPDPINHQSALGKSIKLPVCDAGAKASTPTSKQAGDHANRQTSLKTANAEASTFLLPERGETVRKTWLFDRNGQTVIRHLDISQSQLVGHYLYSIYEGDNAELVSKSSYPIQPEVLDMLLQTDFIAPIATLPVTEKTINQLDNASYVESGAVKFSTAAPSLAPIKLDIHREIEGRVLEILTALAIDPTALRKHIHCPFEAHEDRHPSFRIDASKARFYCSCTPRGGSMIDLVMRLHGHNTAKPAIHWIRDLLKGSEKQLAPAILGNMIPHRRMSFSSLTSILDSKRNATQPDFQAMLDRCIPANYSPNSLHPYVRRKGILPIGALLEPLTNRLVLRLHDVYGRLRGFQTIDSTGNKKFAAGTKLTGSGLLLGDHRLGMPLGFCEGWATGVTIHSMLNIPVVVTFSATNLLAAAKAFSRLTPQRYIFGENDSNGTGRSCAEAAAAAVRGRLWLPPDDFIGDFNDCYGMPFQACIVDDSPTQFSIKASDPHLNGGRVH